jgi:hypothetical protein
MSRENVNNIISRAMNPDQTYKIEETWKIIEFESEIELTNISKRDVWSETTSE